jgi:spore coat protein CotH
MRGAGLLAALLVAGCAHGEPCEGDDVARPEGWLRESHCPGTPRYEKVFDETLVHRFALTITKEDRDATLDDLDDKYSGGSPFADLDALPAPIWVPASVRYDGRSWTKVGMRYKGHASLKGAWQSGVRKLSFILDFDHFEESEREIKDQRFFGFNRLAFSNAYNDPSLIREKVAAEVFRAGGVPAARSAFAHVTLDWGNGPVYLGLYTIVEDPCDAMRATQLGDAGGNLYKPWGDAARWLSTAEVGQSEIEAKFEGCEAVGDRSDAIAAIAALHADRSDAAAWRAALEQRFDVGAFLKALALNQVMMNWDSYGCMHHNYFVYADSRQSGRLRWFPWDLNEAMLAKQQSGCPAPGSVLLEEIVEARSGIDARWPLIRFLLADAEYRATYEHELRSAIDGAFAAGPLVARLKALHALVAPHVTGPEGLEAFPYTNTTAARFQSSIEGTAAENALAAHVSARHAAVRAALGL